MPYLKFISWNINGIRASIKKGLWEKIEEMDADFYGFQEVKCSSEVILEEMAKLNQSQAVGGGLFESTLSTDLNKYNFNYQTATNRAGYSGVLQLIKNNPKIEVVEKIAGVNDPVFDIEGRFVITKFVCDNQNNSQKIALLNGYYPQGGRGPHRVAYKIDFYKKVLQICKHLQKDGFAVILCGDFNTTVADIDLARPAQNRKTTGCLPEEREALGLFFEAGFIDTFRYFYPDLKDKYTYWDQISKARERNVGWRIDYFLVDKSLQKNLYKADILDQIMGSDHCPVYLELKF
jgi:exodeoxyribonuclease-3